MRKTKGQNKRIQEIKHGTLYMAERLGTERLLRAVFDRFEKSIPNSISLSETDIRTFLFKSAAVENATHELQQAIGYFDQLPKKRATEEETRVNITSYAVAIGVPKKDVEAVFNKYDKLLSEASSENERQEIAYMGGIEIHRLLHNRKALVMDGKLIIPAEPGLEGDDTAGSFRKVD